MLSYAQVTVLIHWCLPNALALRGDSPYNACVFYNIFLLHLPCWETWAAWIGVSSRNRFTERTKPLFSPCTTNCSVCPTPRHFSSPMCLSIHKDTRVFERPRSKVDHPFKASTFPNRRDRFSSSKDVVQVDTSTVVSILTFSVYLRTFDTVSNTIHNAMILLSVRNAPPCLQ